MARCAASCSMSERGRSGRQISGGGSLPNSRRLTSAREVMSQHSIRVASGLRVVEDGKFGFPWSARPAKIFAHAQGQVMSRDVGLPLVPIEQDFGVRVCAATACQVGGVPAAAVAVTVTFVEGVKPCAVPSPEK